MSKTLRYLLLLIVILVAACGQEGPATKDANAELSSSSPNPTQASDSSEKPETQGDSQDRVAQTEGQTEEAPAQLPPVLQPTVDPVALTAGKVVNAGVLRDAIIGWVRQPVLIGGYPWLDGDEEGNFGMQVVLVPGPDSGEEDQIVECWPKDRTSYDVSRSTPVVLKAVLGYLQRTPPDTVRLNNCEVVSVGEKFDDTVPAAPGQLRPIPLEKLNQATFALNGTRVSVEGYLKGWSSSTLTDGTWTSIDLQAGESVGMGEPAVSCRLAAEGDADDVIPPAATDQPGGVVMSGLLDYKVGMSDRVYLRDCVFDNRS